MVCGTKGDYPKKEKQNEKRNEKGNYSTSSKSDALSQFYKKVETIETLFH